MRGKVAKRLRRASVQVAKHKPALGVHARHGYALYHPECWRSIYKALKQQWNRTKGLRSRAGNAGS